MEESGNVAVKAVVNYDMCMDVPSDLVGYSPRLIAATGERAALHENLLGRMLISNPPIKECLTRISSPLFLELGAISQLAEWELQGIDAHIQAGLPPFEAAKCCVVFPELRDNYPFPGWRSNESLSQAVLRFTLERMSWTSQSELGVDVVLGEVDEEEFLNAAEAVIRDLFPDEMETATGGDYE